MTSQIDKAEAFRLLHRPGDPIVLFNAWDPGSAKAVHDAGALAIATGSYSVAAAHGYGDGEGLPLELVLANAARMVAAVPVPVTLDFERGYGAFAVEVAASVVQALEAGVVGFNIEDGTDDGLRALPEQVERLSAIRMACDSRQVPAFLNARTDIFLLAPPTAHTSRLVDDALTRARACAEAGADGLFVPGLVDPDLIGAVCAASPLPVNVMMTKASPPKGVLAGLGVARISHGPGPYRLAMEALKRAAQEAMA